MQEIIERRKSNMVACLPPSPLSRQSAQALSALQMPIFSGRVSFNALYIILRATAKIPAIHFKSLEGNADL